ncbi:MAG TPA: bifunctional DNA primase/polymerase [Candidatus Saccharimonadales bacterium]|nr:bifunctional DNA primase/polymerase [Candidatus Saccharimonadales bacterium]
MSASLAIALAHASLGREVFPLKGKVPLVKWTTEATSNPVKVRRLWRTHPDADAVGWRLPEGVVVVDIDDPETFDFTLELPATPMQTTTRGYHLLYRIPPGRTVRQGPIPGGDLKVGGKGYVRIYSLDAFTRLGTIATLFGPASGVIS